MVFPVEGLDFGDLGGRAEELGVLDLGGVEEMVAFPTLLTVGVEGD